jgi:hypothetical protein
VLSDSRLVLADAGRTAASAGSVDAVRVPWSPGRGPLTALSRRPDVLDRSMQMAAVGCAWWRAVCRGGGRGLLCATAGANVVERARGWAQAVAWIAARFVKRAANYRAAVVIVRLVLWLG